MGTDKIPNGDPGHLSSYALVSRIQSMLEKLRVPAIPVNERHDGPSWETTVRGSSYSVPAGTFEDEFIQVEKIGFFASCEFSEYGGGCADEISVSFKLKSDLYWHLTCQTTFYTRDTSGSANLDGRLFMSSCHNPKTKNTEMMASTGLGGSLPLNLAVISIRELLGVGSWLDYAKLKDMRP